MMPKISIYSTAFNAIRNNFDYQGAIRNWSLYADEISIAINTSDDNTFKVIKEFVDGNSYPVKLTKTEISYDDPLAYGKIENAALQACTGDLLIQANLDERWRIDLKLISDLYSFLKNSGAKAFFVPTIDLYGNADSYVNVGKKWYWHLPGLKRGAVKFGIKEDGHPDYSKTSSDELLDQNGDLVPTISLLDDLSIESIQKYVANGMPITYHLGYLNLKDRAERAKWWKDFWEKATNGDKNSHITDVNELLKRETKKHGLPLWEEKQ